MALDSPVPRSSLLICFGSQGSLNLGLAAPYLVDLPADLPDTPHQELLQVATLSARAPVLPIQAPGEERWT